MVLCTIFSMHHDWKEKLYRNWILVTHCLCHAPLKNPNCKPFCSWNLEEDDSSELINAEKELFNLGHQVTYNIFQYSQEFNTLAFLWIARCSMYSCYIPVSIWTFLGSCTCCPQLLQQGIALSLLCYDFYLLGRREKTSLSRYMGALRCFHLLKAGKHHKSLLLERSWEHSCRNCIRFWDIQIPHTKAY